MIVIEDPIEDLEEALDDNNDNDNNNNIQDIDLNSGIKTFDEYIATIHEIIE